jgi:hypothetical protein
VLVDGESGVLLPTALQNHFDVLEVLTKWDERKVHMTKKAVAWRMRAAASNSNSNKWVLRQMSSVLYCTHDTCFNMDLYES